MANGRRLTIFQVMLFLANKIVLMGRESLFSISSSRTCRSSYPASLDQWELLKVAQIFGFLFDVEDIIILKHHFCWCFGTFFYDFPFTLGMSSYVIIFSHSVGNNMNNHPLISILLCGFHIFSIYWECHHPN